MAVALMIAMGALGLAAVVAWLMAVRTARRIPQPASAPPGKPRNLAGIVRAAFSPTDEDKADPALQKQLRTQVQIALACLITMAVASFALPLTPVAAEVRRQVPFLVPPVSWGPPPVAASPSQADSLASAGAAPDGGGDLHARLAGAGRTCAVGCVRAVRRRPAVGGRHRIDGTRLPHAGGRPGGL